jgi:hypothetical protein
VKVSRLSGADPNGVGRACSLLMLLLKISARKNLQRQFTVVSEFMGARGGVATRELFIAALLCIRGVRKPRTTPDHT